MLAPVIKPQTTMIYDRCGRKNNGGILKLGLGLQSAACENGTVPDFVFLPSTDAIKLIFFFPPTRMIFVGVFFLAHEA